MTNVTIFNGSLLIFTFAGSFSCVTLMPVSKFVIVSSLDIKFGFEVVNLQLMLVIFSEQFIDFPLKPHILLIFEIKFTD